MYSVYTQKLLLLWNFYLFNKSFICEYLDPAVADISMTDFVRLPNNEVNFFYNELTKLKFT